MPPMVRCWLLLGPCGIRQSSTWIHLKPIYLRLYLGVVHYS